MAGETTKTTNLTNAQAGTKVNARAMNAKQKVGRDFHAYSTGELELADVLITNITLPTNAIVDEVLIYSDDLDSNGSPALAMDIGFAAGQDFTSVTSSTATKHSEDDVPDADALVDGDTTAQEATTKYTSLDLDSGTAGPDDIHKAVWEVLGYDEDPKATVRIAVTVATAAATAAAGDFAILVRYSVD